jgi:predicted transcriptional regulator
MRRTRLEIIYDILKAVQEKGGSIKPTHLLYKSNLSHQNMKAFIEELKQKGMVEEEIKKKSKIYSISNDGLKFLAEYKKIREFTDSFGF